MRTTNLIERSFEEERRRTKTIPRFFDEKSGLKLVFSALTRAARRWQRVAFSAEETAAVQNLRQDLGIAPSPQSISVEGGVKKTYAA